MKTSRSLITGAARMLGAIALGVVLLGATNARAGSLVARHNIVDLISQSEIIIRGNVVELTDGFDEKNLPYTQVTVRISETLRGDVTGEFTFRQFGLLKPREINGRMFLGITPTGWSTYKTDEEVMLFLYKAASVSGLRTTVGLNQGKFAITAGGALSQADNDGLFENVTIDKTKLNTTDRRLLATRKGAVNAEALTSFVRRAVNDKWIEKGEMRRAN